MSLDVLQVVKYSSDRITWLQHMLKHTHTIYKIRINCKCQKLKIDPASQTGSSDMCGLTCESYGLSMNDVVNVMDG